MFLIKDTESKIDAERQLVKIQKCLEIEDCPIITQYAIKCILQLCARCSKNFVYNDGLYCEECIEKQKSIIESALDEYIEKKVLDNV